MNEEVTKITEELIRLYDDGAIMLKRYKDIADKIIPTRYNFHIPQIKVDSFGIPYQEPEPKPTPEHHQLNVIVEKVEKYIKDWEMDINKLLSKVKQTRFKLQFNNPNQKIPYPIRTGDTTEKEQYLDDMIYSFEEKHKELRAIIIELEQSNEVVQKPDMKNLEPATYDKKTRTIFFADEAIRFRKDANYTTGVLAMIFDKPKKLWTMKEFMKVWDDYYEYLGNEKPNNWQKIYQAFKKANERVTKITGINDLFKFSTTSVRLNPAYL